MLAIMDAAFNVTMQPFRALVSDMVPSEQRNLGYSVQSLLINIGAVIGSLLPFLLTNVIGLDNAAKAGEVAPSVIWAFYIGATVLLGSVLWTVFRTKEYSPEEYNLYKGIEDAPMPTSTQKTNLRTRMSGFVDLIVDMPTTMKQLAVVQFFSWFALFIMWVYTMPAIAQHIWGIDAKWFSSEFLNSVGNQLPLDIAKAKGQAGDWVGIIFAAYSLFAAIFSVFLTRIANRFGRKKTYAGSLILGGIGYLSFGLFPNSEIVHVNLLITEVDIPQSALMLLIPMIGVGIAWAAILAMPYAILSDSIPAQKMGVYMGIFNFTIAAPQIVSGLIAGQLLRFVFDNEAIYIIGLAGVFMLLGAVSVYFVKVSSSPETSH